MFGYTEDELDKYFDGHTHAHAEKMGLSYSDYREEQKRWFNGYRFGRSNKETVYNPVSIGVNLSMQEAFLQPSLHDGRPQGERAGRHCGCPSMWYLYI